MSYVLDQDIPSLPALPTLDQRASYEKWLDDDNKAWCYVLAFMSNELQYQHEDMKTVMGILTYLEELYGEQSHAACYEVSKRLFKMKMHDGQSVYDHCLTMIKDLEELEKLSTFMDKELQIDLILQSLTDSYAQFIINYHMNKIQCTKAELLNILITTEGILKSSKGFVLTVEQTSSSKRKSTMKKKKFMKKQKIENRPKKKVSKRRATDKGKYFHCNTDGYQKMNYPDYLANLKNKKDGTPCEGMSDLLIIETNLMIFSTFSWVLDSGLSAQICTTIQDLIEYRRLREDDMILRISNGAKVTVEIIGTYPL